MIDIIVPVYNTPISDLKRCLESIERQSFKDYKVYIIDDGSFDEVKLFLDEYVKDKSNFIVKHVVNGGVSRARNIGIDSSSSLYLAFVDSDDTLEDNFLEEAFSLINGNDLDLVIGGYNEIKNGKVVKMRKCDEGFYIYDESNLNLVMDKLLSGKLKEDNKNIGSLPTGRIYTRIYKRCVLGDLRFNSSLGMSEDTLFMIDFMNRVKRIGLSSSIWYNYYINDYSISRRKVSDKVINDHMMFIEEVYKRMLVEDDLRIKNAYIFRVFKSLINLVDLIKSSDYSEGTLDKVLYNSMFSCLKDLDISSYINVSDKEVEFLDDYIASYI